jgi:type IV secretion system protein VirD4
MTDFVLAWAAFKNMMRYAARNPLWAIIAIVTSPLRAAAAYLFQNGLFFVLVVMVVGFGLMGIMQAAGIRPGNPLWIVANIAFIVFLLLLFRFLTRPMIDHFGDIDADTHGSARFATRKEVALLTRAAGGLLIGRDAKTGKLLRYDGPAHLLTMAPTRTGKGVGAIIPNLLTTDRSVICIDPKGKTPGSPAAPAKSSGRSTSSTPSASPAPPRLPSIPSTSSTRPASMPPRTPPPWPTPWSTTIPAPPAKPIGTRKPRR